jgi:hypothetical protein
VDVVEQTPARATRVDVVYTTMVGTQLQSPLEVGEDAELDRAMLLNVFELDWLLRALDTEKLATETDAERLVSVLLYFGLV